MDDEPMAVDTAPLNKDAQPTPNQQSQPSQQLKLLIKVPSKPKQQHHHQQQGEAVGGLRIKIRLPVPAATPASPPLSPRSNPLLNQKLPTLIPQIPLVGAMISCALSSVT